MIPSILVQIVWSFVVERDDKIKYPKMQLDRLGLRDTDGISDVPNGAKGNFLVVLAFLVEV